MNGKPEAAIEKEAYWKHLIDEYLASGLKQSNFCFKKQLPYHQFKYWLDRFRGPKTKETLKLTEVKLNSSAFIPIKIRLPCGIEIQIQGNFEIIKEILNFSGLKSC